MIRWEEHFDTLVLVPTVLLQKGTCEDPACESSHWALRIGWLCWTVGFEL